ncbi:MAG: hypothetical protein QF464_22650, partial [Myxococcota bacterium]|nr:hypothetical protein [Myxococcota bacterium]
MPKRAQITTLAIAFAWLVPPPAIAAVPADIPTEVPEGLEWPDELPLPSSNQLSPNQLDQLTSGLDLGLVNEVVADVTRL